MTFRPTRTWTRAVVGMVGLVVAAQVSAEQVPAGQWQASVAVNGLDIPFRFDIAAGKAGPVGAFFNGEQRIGSTGGTLVDDVLTLRFDQYGATLQATYRDGRLEGTYDRGVRGAYPFRAQPIGTAPAPVDAPAIDGEWTIATESSKGSRPGASSCGSKARRCRPRSCVSTATPAR